ncbi:MAG: HlyD family efflux transporter periplasmic adaptor subunit [Porcipelethomonas sp.]
MKSVTSRIVSLLLVICITTCLFSIGYHIVNKGYETETAVLSTADELVSFKGVYIRDESLVKYSGNGAVNYCVADGGKLGKGSVIAEIYSDESQIDNSAEIAALEHELELLKKIQNPGTVELAQPANIAGLVEERYKDIISLREKGKIDEISSDRDELLVLMSTYQLVTDADIDLTQRISEISSRISQLKASGSVPLDTIVSDSSAYFVSYADGYEDKFSSQTLQSITADDIKNASDGNTNGDWNVIGKLISGYEWYIAGVIDNSKQFCSLDDKVTMKFRSTSDMVEGTVFDIRATEKNSESIVIIKCDEMTYDLVQHRTESVDMIKGEYEGIKIPRKAIRFKDTAEYVTDESGEERTEMVNSKGVYVKVGEQIVFKKLDVIYEGDRYVLSALNAGSDYVALYDDIVVEGVEEDGS